MAAYLVAVQCAELDRKTRNENNSYQSHGRKKKEEWTFSPGSQKCNELNTSNRLRFNQRRVSNRVTLQSVLRESERNMRYMLDLHR